MAVLPAGWLEHSRDTAGDVGTSISETSELEREGLADVVAAAGKRAGEALRVIEEVGKTMDRDMAGRVERIRYRLYDAEAKLQRRLATGRARQWRVCVLLTESMCALPWLDVLRAAIDGGADCVQVREKTLGAADLARRAEQIVEIARPAGVSVIVNDRADVATAVGADGVHLGRKDLSIPDTRRLFGRALLIGASTRALPEAAEAIAAGADYCGVGTMYRTPTKDARPTGPAYLQAYLEKYQKTPHLAIGGITPDNLDRLIEAGAQGVAVASCVCKAPKPGAVVRTLLEALESSPAAVRHAEVGARESDEVAE